MIKKLTKTIVVGTLVMSLGIVNVFANSYKGYVLPARLNILMRQSRLSSLD